MAERSSQTHANHVRLDPPFHFFVLPVLAISWIVSVVVLVRRPCFLHFWLVVFSTAITVAVIRFRQYALKVQDRVIRLEERLRYQRLLPADLQSRIDDFTLNQLVSLRFASDAELPALARKVLDDKIDDRKTIKQMIKVWRPDYLRA